MLDQYCDYDMTTKRRTWKCCELYSSNPDEKLTNSPSYKPPPLLHPKPETSYPHKCSAPSSANSGYGYDVYRPMCCAVIFYTALMTMLHCSYIQASLRVVLIVICSYLYTIIARLHWQWQS